MSLVADSSIFDDARPIDTMLVAGTPDYAIAYTSTDFHTWLRRLPQRREDMARSAPARSFSVRQGSSTE
jgi:hypothetical protein